MPPIMLLFLGLVLLLPSSLRAEPPVTSTYFRQSESQDGQVLTMQLAMRRFERANDDRTVWLAAMVHIGDRGFYTTVQSRLDELDLVLFEGVRPPGAGRAEFDLAEATDDSRIKRTKRRIRSLAIAAEIHNRAHGRLPSTVDELVAGSSGRTLEFVNANLEDGWGRPLHLSLRTPESPDAAPAIEITSRGADGQSGGNNAAADIRLSDLPPIKPSEVPKPNEGRGLQQQMASALGLVFQLDVMDHAKPNWRSSDLSVDQVAERMGDGGDANELFRMLDGSGFTGTLAKMVMGLVRLFPTAQVYGKLALMEAMLRADDLMLATPRSMARAFDVILHDRNAVVLGDLKGVLETEPALKRIGIIYGGAHMAGIEAGLRELGFTDAGADWHDAIRLDLRAAGFTAKEARDIREMIGKSLDGQIAAAKRKQKKTRNSGAD
ncbi:MAG: type II secretion system protein GspG [Phycisphaerales bacterium]